MGIGKQAKVLTEHQLRALLSWFGTRQFALRNRVIVLLSFKAGLRAKEIAHLRWNMVMDAKGSISDQIHLRNDATKGKSGRIIAMNKHLRRALIDLARELAIGAGEADSFVVLTQRGQRTSAQVVVNLFQGWYRKLGFVGCSSHSGRRTFITNAARKASTVGGSLRDVQQMAGHASLTTTARYIETDAEAQAKLVNII